MRLRPDEWPEPVSGMLRVQHMSYAECAARRTLRRLDLLGEWVSHPICLMHLFEPEFVDVVGDGMLMRGHVIQSRDGRTHEHEQLWLVRPRSSAKGPPLPRFDPSKWVRRLPVEESTGQERSISEQWHERHVRLG